MVEEKLKEWIEEKLEKGVEKERIKESLENTGKDPSLVDEVESPFEGKEAENVFEEDEEKNTKEEEKQEQEKNLTALKEKIPTEALQQNKKMLAGSAVFLIIISLGFGLISSDVQIGPDYTGCDGQVMLIEDLETDGESTEVLASASSTTTATVGIYENDHLIDQKNDTFEGEQSFSFEAVGDQVKFHPVGCTDIIDTHSY